MIIPQARSDTQTVSRVWGYLQIHPTDRVAPNLLPFGALAERVVAELVKLLALNDVTTIGERVRTGVKGLFPRSIPGEKATVGSAWLFFLSRADTIRRRYSPVPFYAGNTSERCPTGNKH